MKRRLPKQDRSKGRINADARRIASNLPTPTSHRHNHQWPQLFAVSVIALIAVVVYGNSLSGPFIFDDEEAIVQNATIRQLWPLSMALSPPNHGEPVTGRPLLNLSLAINYASSGLNVWSYHATNLAIHVACSLLLFGVVCRTFLLPVMRARWAAAATPLAFLIALLWAIHPLQTESVTYISQRAESLVGLFYLLTLYCFVRGVYSARTVVWYIGAVLACLLGMASKEVMVSAPLIVLLYDRTFLAGSFNHAVRRRAGFYAALAGAWLLLGGLVIAANNRGGTAGFDSGLSSWKYLCTQFGAIVHYLRLSLWPYPLLLDYGTSMAKHILEIVPYAIIVAALASVTAVALWRWPKVGFLGAWFFAILAPTSSIVPVTTQTVAEHRMYLPLAAVLAALVVGGYAIGRQLAHRGVLRLSTWLPLSGSLWVCMAVALAILTVQRNNDYSSELAIWADTAAKAPTNARAQGNFGRALAKQGQIDEAIIHYQKALEIRPDYADVHNNFGLALATRGQADDAIVHYQKALDVDPAYVPAHNDLGLALLSRGQVDEAIIHFRRAVSLRPDLTEVENNLGMALARRGQLDEAIVHYTKALTMNPAYAEAENNLGNALARRGQLEDAVAHYRAALKINPHFVAARQNLRVAMNRLP